MIRYKFIKYRDKGNLADTNTIIFKSVAISQFDILQDFEDFLKACGFYIDGTIEVVPLDE